MTRHEARELAFILLFEKTFTDEDIPAILEKAQDAREVETDAFCLRLAEGAAARFEELDAIFEPALHNWSKARLTRVALSVLRLAVYELAFDKENPTGVVINEAVEIAKKYGGAEDAQFINGVLGTLARA